MDAFLNSIKGIANQTAGKFGQPRFATVESVDSMSYTVRVAIQPEGILTGWLPVMTLWAGAGWGLGALPAPGDQVILIAQEGDPQQAIVLGRIWSAKTANIRPPVGELWLTHASGSMIRLLNDGSIESAAPVWRHTGDFRVSGDVFDGHGSVSDLRQHYNEHTHPPDTATAEPQD